MSVINVLVGQCGNQVGTDFLKSVATSFDLQRGATEELPSTWEIDDTVSSFFRAAPVKRSSLASSSAPPLRARAVCIDMEPKVIRTCDESAQQHFGFSLPPEGSPGRITRSSGSGNNWACGYCVHGHKTSDAIVEGLRREAEAASASLSFGGFHVVHSAAGGTGSGIGSLASDLIREHFGRATPVVHTIVWPFEHGELSPQWLNCALSLRVLDDTADAVHVISNDVATDSLRSAPIFSNRGFTSARSVSVPFSSVNAWIAREMAALWLPGARRVPAALLGAEYSAVAAQQSSLTLTNNSNIASTIDYLPPVSFADRIDALTSTTMESIGSGGSRRVFFESVGTVSVLDDPDVSRCVLAASQRGGSSSPGRHNDDDATMTNNAQLLRTYAMLHGVSTNSFADALMRTYRLSDQMCSEGEDHQGSCSSSSSLRIRNARDLIVAHGPAAQRVWLSPPLNTRMVGAVCRDGGADDDADDKTEPVVSPARVSLNRALLADTTVIAGNRPVEFSQEAVETEKTDLAAPSSLSLFSNSMSFGLRVERAMVAAETLLSTGAFVHHFTQMGLEEDDLKEAVMHGYGVASKYGVEL